MVKYANIIKRLPTWIYKLGAELWYDKDFPRHIFIELTTRCNLSCDYCPRPKRNEDMDWNTFRRIIIESKGHGPRSFSFHLFGEPLLYPRLIDACSFVKQSHKNNTILLTTNGTLLRQYYGDLVKCGVDKIIWSYKKGQEIPKEAESWEKVTIRFMKGEEQSFPRMEIRSLHNYGGTMLSEKYGVTNTDVGKRWTCYHLYFAPAISVNGDILICCADPLKKSVIGNLKNMSISQAWKKIEPLREEQRKGIYKGICEKCNVWTSYPDMFFT